MRTSSQQLDPSTPRRFTTATARVRLPTKRASNIEVNLQFLRADLQEDQSTKLKTPENAGNTTLWGLFFSVSSALLLSFPHLKPLVWQGEGEEEEHLIVIALPPLATGGRRAGA